MACAIMKVSHQKGATSCRTWNITRQNEMLCSTREIKPKPKILCRRGTYRVPSVHDAHEEECEQQEGAVDQLERAARSTGLVKEPVDV